MAKDDEARYFEFSLWGALKFESREVTKSFDVCRYGLDVLWYVGHRYKSLCATVSLA